MNGLPASWQRWTRVLCVATCVLAAVPAAAQLAGPDLWMRRDMPAGLKRPPDVLDSIAVDVRVDALRSNVRLSLPLPDGSKMLAVRTRLVETPKGYVWNGTVGDRTIGNATFSVVNETVAGSVLSGRGRSFRLRRDISGVYLLEEIDPRKLPPEGEATPASGVRSEKGNDPAFDTCATDSGDEIDLMVVYTAAARSYAGADALEADIYLGVEQANESYIRSAVAQHLRLVHVGEVSYTESGNSVTDRDRLKAGLVGNVHGLRNSHGADVVALITETLDVCGESFTMDQVGNAFESSAFSVVKRDCMSASGKYTLAHELGHLMGALHDWNRDGHVLPYLYAHGHVEMSPVTGPPWRTVMAYDDLCQDAGISCPRVLNWSNPNISIGGSWTGIGTGQHPEDNHRVLNDTAKTVANFRCGSPSRGDTWMKDSWSDTGSEPDPAQAGQPMWESPYLWVRNEQDLQLIHQHEHQNPISGRENFIYVKVHNGGPATSGKLDVRVANATLGLSWPGSWATLPSGPVTVALAADATRIVEVPWTPSGLGHFCFIARWDSASDPMTTPEGSDIEANVRSNNNIIWRNVQIIDLGAESSAEAAFDVPGVGAGRSFVLAIRPVPTRHPAGRHLPHFMSFGRMTVTLDDRLTQAWKRASYRGEGLRRDGRAITVLDPRGVQLTLGPLAASGRARIVFSRPRGGRYPRDEFAWRVILSPADDGVNRQARSGITYLVRTFAR